MKKLRELILMSFEKYPNSRVFVISVLMVTIWLGIQTYLAPEKKDEVPHAQEGADTFIPAGFVLVPIEIDNKNGLDGIIHQFAVVDLYTAAIEGKPSKLIARRLRLMRAPLDTSQFAVLAPEAEAPALVKEPGPFYVMVQNPNQKATQFSKATKLTKRILQGVIE